MLPARMIVPPDLISELCPFYFFPPFFVCHITQLQFEKYTSKLYRNVFRVKLLWLLSVSELWPFDCVFMLFCIIYILVHAITHSEFSQDNKSGTRMNVSTL